MPVFLAGDWGTTKLRLFVCDAQDSGIRIVDTCESLGVAKVTCGDFESVLLEAISDWRTAYDFDVVLLSGMIGSDIGWRKVGYLPCPARPDAIGSNTEVFDVDSLRIGIVPGLVCENPLGQPDVMRGEETQLLNWSARTDDHASGLVACPGTHNKWVQIRQGNIDHFMTTMTGELYACLREHSVLIHNADDTFDESAFVEGVNAVKAHPGHFNSLLFSTRSRQVLNQLADSSASAYLSGLLVAADCLGALDVFDRADEAVTLLGEPQLNLRYATALDALAIDSVSVDVSTLGAEGFLQLLTHSGLQL